MESQVNVKVFQPLHHKGGNNINKILNINDNKDNTFSFDEYRNAIENERVKRQTILKANNEEIVNRRELKLFTNLNDPKLFEKNQQLSNRVMIERIKQNVSKNVRKHHNDIFEARQYVNRYNLSEGKPNNDNWNINNITFETSENGSHVTRVVIQKQRGNKQNELIIPKL